MNIDHPKRVCRCAPGESCKYCDWSKRTPSAAGANPAVDHPCTAAVGSSPGSESGARQPEWRELVEALSRRAFGEGANEFNENVSAKRITLDANRHRSALAALEAWCEAREQEIAALKEQVERLEVQIEVLQEKIEVMHENSPNQRTGVEQAAVELADAAEALPNALHSGTGLTERQEAFVFARGRYRVAREAARRAREAQP